MKQLLDLLDLNLSFCYCILSLFDSLWQTEPRSMMKAEIAIVTILRPQFKHDYWIFDFDFSFCYWIWTYYDKSNLVQRWRPKLRSRGQRSRSSWPSLGRAFQRNSSWEKLIRISTFQVKRLRTFCQIRNGYSKQGKV